jgi:hypothetical protein
MDKDVVTLGTAEACDVQILQAPLPDHCATFERVHADTWRIRSASDVVRIDGSHVHVLALGGTETIECGTLQLEFRTAGINHLCDHAWAARRQSATRFFRRGPPLHASERIRLVALLVIDAFDKLERQRPDAAEAAMKWLADVCDAVWHPWRRVYRYEDNKLAALLPDVATTSAYDSVGAMEAYLAGAYCPFGAEHFGVRVRVRALPLWPHDGLDMLPAPVAAELRGDNERARARQKDL